MDLTRRKLEEIRKCLVSGGLVAFPTDTVYGVAANPFSDLAVEKIFKLKQRNNENRLALLGADTTSFAHVAEFSEVGDRVANAYWPGALTLILPLKPGHGLSDLVTNGGDTIGIRVPDSDIARAILSEYNAPLAVTSVNKSGERPLLTAEEVNNQFGEMIDCIVDGVCSDNAIASTVIDITGRKPKIIRQGGIAEGDIIRLISQP